MHGPLRAAFVHRRFIAIDEDLCVGCAMCTKACPLKNVIRIDKGTGKAVVFAPYYCAGCLKCADRCPSKAIRSVTFDELNSIE